MSTQDEFRRDLARVLNCHSMENGSNTPDYQLADYLIECLRALDSAINVRAKWYGRSDYPGASLAPTQPPEQPPTTEGEM